MQIIAELWSLRFEWTQHRQCMCMQIIAMCGCKGHSVLDTHNGCNDRIIAAIGSRAKLKDAAL
jgi:hypothetical protein